MFELIEADHKRYRRTVRLVAWALSWIPGLVMSGVAAGMGRAPRVHDLKVEDLAKTAPSFRSWRLDEE
jgi:hypothetical protein